MNILLVSKKIGCSRCFSFGSVGMITVALSIFVLLPAISLYTGYRLGQTTVSDKPDDRLANAIEQEMVQQRSEIMEAKRQAEDNLNALTLRLGKLQAHVIRLDALGQRLTNIAGLDNGEFNFHEPPAQGGPESSGELSSIAVSDFLSQLDDLSRTLENRDQQLGMLEKMMMNRNLQAEVNPTGRPIKKGWISSQFGMRTDPFSGKQEFHKGMDLAGKKGSDVIAVASGVVTWSGERYGYGIMVEIDHGKGLATRYGHNLENLVQVGDKVKKGQLIAKMGSTGRSTGPHVHFEVLRNGKAVDPRKYIYAKNNS